MTETATATPFPFLFGTYTLATLPPAANNNQALAYVTDMNGGCYMGSNGTSWQPLVNRRVELFAGVTNASGDYTVVYNPAYPVTPQVQPVTMPPADSTTRVRITASSATGFTVKTERNAGVNLLGIDVLLLGTSNVPAVPVNVIVVSQ